MAKRYELSDASWDLIKDLVSPKQKIGRPRSDHRLILHGILWILCSGAAWRDLPERFGPRSTVYQRFRDWRCFGWSASGKLEVGIATRWISESQPVSFALGDFRGALEGFENLLKEQACQ